MAGRRRWRTSGEAYWDSKVKAAEGKFVFLVEGDDDRMVLENFLREVVGMDWASRLSVIASGGRSEVYEQLHRFPHGSGIVDRDCWTDADIQEQRHARPAVYVTQGWCTQTLVQGPLPPPFKELRALVLPFR